MARSGILAMAALACAVGVSAAACATRQASRPRPDPSGVVVSADPRLAAAVSTIRALTGKSKTFAGIVEDPGNHKVIVYRLPDPSLDARIRAEVTGVTVIVRDATYSRVQMTGFIDRIMSDRDYWRTQGIKIGGGVPDPTGSGVTVLVTTDPDTARMWRSKHYPAMRMFVLKEGAGIPPLPRPTIRITVPVPLRSKSLPPH